MTDQPDPRRRRALAQLSAGSLAAVAPWALSPVFAQAKPLTIGVIYVGPKDDFGFNQAQAEAATAVKKMAGVKVVEEENVPETTAVQKSMAGMIQQDGAGVIFATSFGYFDPHVIALAPKYPDVRFSNCGGLWTEQNPNNAGSYFSYIEECQFLNGVVAGHMTKSKKLGFVAAKPIPQVLKNINAFTLGARSVDPSITTTVIFTGEWSMPVKEAEATNSLADQGADVFTMHVDGPKVVVETAAKRGKYVCGYHTSQAALAPKAYLTGAEWNWLPAYTTIIDAARNGKPHPNFLRGGLKQGYVKMSAYGPMVTAPAKKMADDIKAKMIAGEFDVFKGGSAGLKDNKGGVVVAAGKSMKQTDIELEKMNYLIDGVVGSV